MENNFHEDVNVLIKRRLEELEELQKKNVQPFEYSFDINSNSDDIKKNFTDDVKREVKIAGRIMAIRKMGKASFAHIQDLHGRIQIYLKKDEIGEAYENFKLMDIGDIIGVEGFTFRTKTGEISVHVAKLQLLTKSLRPIPIAKEIIDEAGNKQVFDQFSDKELRYRQRYIDLVVNPEIRNVFITRSKIISAIRKYLDDREILEVETPILQTLYGGASARPFKTHHNALDVPLYLRIADELYLKRLIVGGFTGVYEISKDFRNEGIDRTHNPEFTMMEVYVAYKDYEWMMQFVEELVEFVCGSVFGTTKFTIEGTEIDFKAPWKRVSLTDSLNEKLGINVLASSEEELKSIAKKHGASLEGTESKGKLIDIIFEELIQSSLVQPSFLIDYPIETSPLAKKHRSKEGLVERFEGFVIGREICNAFSELNDPIDQRERFEAQLMAIEKGDQEAQQLDEDFIRALEYGMPPTAGLGIGIDRLVMLMTSQSSIRDVIFFPTMKPQK